MIVYTHNTKWHVIALLLTDSTQRAEGEMSFAEPLGKTVWGFSLGFCKMGFHKYIWFNTTVGLDTFNSPYRCQVKVLTNTGPLPRGFGITHAVKHFQLDHLQCIFARAVLSVMALQAKGSHISVHTHVMTIQQRKFIDVLHNLGWNVLFVRRSIMVACMIQQRQSLVWLFDKIIYYIMLYLL